LSQVVAADCTSDWDTDDSANLEDRYCSGRLRSWEVVPGCLAVVALLVEAALADCSYGHSVLHLSAFDSSFMDFKEIAVAAKTTEHEN